MSRHPSVVVQLLLSVLLVVFILLVALPIAVVLALMATVDPLLRRQVWDSVLDIWDDVMYTAKREWKHRGKK